MRCLVIEDEADTARYICNGLTEDGFDTIWCRNGTDGLRLATGESWDVVVLDRMLPGDVEGLTIVETMRGQGKTTPIIVLSALANLDERVKGLRSGGDDYLTKPFGMTELVARIHALLRRAAPATDAPELCVGDLRLDLRRRRAERAGQPIMLQPRDGRSARCFERNRARFADAARPDSRFLGRAVSTPTSAPFVADRARAAIAGIDELTSIFDKLLQIAEAEAGAQRQSAERPRTVMAAATGR